MGVLKDMLIKVVAAMRPVFIQGFPRDIDQAMAFEAEVIAKFVLLDSKKFSDMVPTRLKSNM